MHYRGAKVWWQEFQTTRVQRQEQAECMGGESQDDDTVQPILTGCSKCSQVIDQLRQHSTEEGKVCQLYQELYSHSRRETDRTDLASVRVCHQGREGAEHQRKWTRQACLQSKWCETQSRRRGVTRGRRGILEKAERIGKWRKIKREFEDEESAENVSGRKGRDEAEETSEESSKIVQREWIHG